MKTESSSAPQSPGQARLKRVFRFGVRGVVVAALLAGVAWACFSRSRQRIVLPSGYTLTLLEVYFPPFNTRIFGGPWWNAWLARLPMNRIPNQWAIAQAKALHNSQRLGSTTGIGLWESLTPPKLGPLPLGREGIHHQILPEHGYLPNEPMGGGGRPDFVTCWADSFPRRANAFRIQVFALENGRIGKLLGEFKIRNPHPDHSPGWAGDPLPLAKTNGAVSCELLSLETADAEPSARLQHGGLLQLRIRERGIIATHWAAASIRILDSTGNKVDHVDNLGFTNGVLRAGFYPLWPGDEAWKVEVDLARTRQFPSENQWTLEVTNNPNAVTADRMASKAFGGVGFRAVLATPGMLEFPDGMTDAIAAPQFWVQALRPPQGYSLRLVDLVDQSGRPVAWKRSQWGGNIYRWILAEPSVLRDGTVQSLTARLSWEPTLSFTFLAHPTVTKEFGGWPRRPDRGSNSPADWLRLP